MIRQRNAVPCRRTGSGIEEAATYLRCARTGPFNHDLSASFKQVACFTFELFPEKIQRSLSVIIQQNPHQLDDVCIFENEMDPFFSSLSRFYPSR